MKPRAPSGAAAWAGAPGAPARAAAVMAGGAASVQPGGVPVMAMVAAPATPTLDLSLIHI
ncbi:hypothetical protein [Xylophilus sp. ASV27]|uniref:hypothetical protein n=1 Tax=Xylophilus sp. ASV27 TaxID=2795129 RepID=UPI0018ED4975|nr:hypothetical protein [Xylophilus sp. ASV27]